MQALLGIETADDLYVHPVVGASWEGFVIEQLIGCIGDPSVESSFYRAVASAELDLILSSSTGKQAFEIKLGLTPRLSKGYHLALADLDIRVAYRSRRSPDESSRTLRGCSPGKIRDDSGGGTPHFSVLHEGCGSSTSSEFTANLDTLAVQLTLPLAGRVGDLHPQVRAPCRGDPKDPST